MILNDIILLSQNLSSIEDDAETSLNQFILEAYYQKLDQQFSQLFAIHRKVPYIVAQFEEILAANWLVIQNSFLCYTAMPKSKATLLLCEIAEYIANKRKDKPAIAYLMPGIQLESLANNYPHLASLDIKQVIQTHILGQNACYLIPVKLLAELPHPTLPKPPFYHPYFQELEHAAQDCMLHLPEEIRLFKHSRLSMRIHRTRQALAFIMHDSKHFLGQLNQASHLLKLGSIYGDGEELEAKDTAYEGIIRLLTYYDKLFSKKLFRAKVLDDDLSPYQQAYLWINRQDLYYVDANNQANKIDVDNQLFRDNLKKIRDMQSGHPHAFILSPKQLDILFADTEYLWLDPRIPQGLHQYIMYLGQMCSNLDSHHNAFINMDACVAGQRETLLFYIAAHGDKFIQFSSADDDNDADKLEQAILDYTQAKEDLRIHLSQVGTSKPLGHDRLEGHTRLLEKFQRHFEIQSMDDLNIFQHLSLDELKSLFKAQGLRHQAVLAIPDANECVMYFQDLSFKSLNKFTQILAEELKIHFFHDIDSLNILLKMLDADKAGMVLENLGSNYIFSFAQFIELSQGMSPQHFRISCAKIKPTLLKYLNINHFIMHFTHIDNPENKAGFLNCFLQELAQKIDTVTEFENMRLELDLGNQALLFKLMQTEFPRIITRQQDLQDLIVLLNPKEQSVLLNIVMPILPRWIDDIEDLARVIWHLSTSEMEEFYQAHLPFIKTILSDIQQLSNFLTLIPIKQQQEFCIHYRQEWFDMYLMNEDEQNYPGLPKNSDKLKLFCLSLTELTGPKIAKNFCLSLIAGDDSAIQTRFHRFFEAQPVLRFFPAHQNLDKMLALIHELPKSWLKKLYSALGLELEHKPYSLENYVAASMPATQAPKKKTRLNLAHPAL